MKLALDTSALVKHYLAEAGADELEALLARATEVGLCVLCVPEVASALFRRRRERSLTTDECRLAQLALAADVRDATTLHLTPRVVDIAVKLLEREPLRASDALHVACAVEWEPELFVTGDRRQAAAARAAGLIVKLIGAEP